MATQGNGLTSSSLFDSGASNLSILESVGTEILNEHSSAPSPGADPIRGDDGTEHSPSVGAGGAEVTPRPEWFEAAPDQLKGLLGAANVSAEAKKFLEETYGELNTFKGSPVGTKEAVQELSELFPGGMEDIKSAHENAQLFTRQMEQIYSIDPSQQVEVLAQIVQTNPDAYVSMLNVGADLLKQTLRDDYNAFATNLAHEHLETITDGKFAQFFDSVSKMAADYHGLMDTNPEAAAKLAAKLGGAALQMSDWWGGAKNKLGYGEKAAERTGARGPVTTTKPEDSRETSLAQRESDFFKSNHLLKHDSAVNPVISQSLVRELAARKMDLPQSWQSRVTQFVSDGIKQNLIQDKGYLALENRVRCRNAPNDPRKWDNSENASRTLLAAARQRAEKLIPGLLKRALDDLSSLRPQAAKPVVPGAGDRGGGRPAAGGAGGGSSSWEDDMKAGNISTAEAIGRVAGI